MQTFKQFHEDMTSSTAFGSAASGSTGNQFPSQTDAGYAPGDARLPTYLGAKKVKSRRRKKNKLAIPMQRRKLSIYG